MSSQIQRRHRLDEHRQVTIGGNDVGFSSLILQCTLGSCSSALNSTRAGLNTSLAPKLDTVYSAIKSRAPSATVVVLGYPRLFSTSSCLGTSGISAQERSDANLLADAVDSVTAARAAAYGFTYKSAIASWTGHAVCSSSAWLNGLNIFNTTESYHPTRRGHS